MPDSPTFLARGHTPTISDTSYFREQRIVGALNDMIASSGSGMVGVVDPESVVTAAPGTTYTNTANKTLWIKESGIGSIGWQQYI